MPAGDDSFHPSSAVGPHKPAAASALAGLNEARSVYLRFVTAIEDDGRYPLEAYRFLQEGLEYAVRRTHGASAFEQPPSVSSAATDPRHVDGGQLCLSLRDLALARWGRLARTVLNAWGVHSTRDFGEMVFVLVANEFLHKTEQDTLDDFEHVFAFADFEHLYQMPFLPLHQSDFEYSAESAPTASHGGSLA